jgi:hypothetical protein
MNKETACAILSSFVTVATNPSEEEQQRLTENESLCRTQIEQLPETFLPNQWMFFMDPNLNEGPRNISRGVYLKGLRVSAGFSTLKSICQYALDACERTGKVMLFKEGIKPIWEDRNNFNGGRFHLCCVTKQQAVVSFAMMLASILSNPSSEDSLVPYEELCGMVVSLRAGSLGVELWNKSAKKKEKVKNTRKNLKKYFKRNILYYVHRTSVNISKYGIDAVLPVIEKEKEEKELRNQAKVQEEKSLPPSTEPLQQKDFAPTKQPLVKSCQQENMVDALTTALLSASLSNAWNASRV